MTEPTPGGWTPEQREKQAALSDRAKRPPEPAKG
jgi:hypothetical protein